MRFREKFLLIENHGWKLGVSSGCIKLEHYDKDTQYIPIDTLHGISIVAGTSVTTPCLSELNAAKVPFIIQGGYDDSICVTGRSKNIFVRRNQVLVSSQHQKAAMIAKEMVEKKIESMALFSGNEKLLKYRDMLSNTPLYHGIMGIEGVSTREYFESIKVKWESIGWRFGRRSYRPPENPANSIMSYSYKLLMDEISRWALLFGLDPDFGFLHRLTYGRPSLLCDLVEPFRSIHADKIAFQLIEEMKVTEKDFSDSDEYGYRFSNQEKRREYVIKFIERLREDALEEERIHLVRWLVRRLEELSVPDDYKEAVA